MMRNGKLYYWFLVTVLGLFLPLLTFTKLSRHHKDLPVGCDEFGYLQLSKYFPDSINHEFPHRELALHLESKGVNLADYAWMIAPHAHHFVENPGKVINQYPPGTSALLKFFPDHMKKMVFPGVVVLVTIVLASWALWLIGASTVSHALYILILIFCGVLLPVVGTEFTRINSVSPTYGLLLGAGVLLLERRNIALIFLSLTVIFRIADLVLLSVMATCVGLQILFQNKNQKSFMSLIQDGLATLTGGVVILIFNFFLLGAPLMTTYSTKDQSWVSSWAEILDNLQFYFLQKPGWFYIHLAGFLGLFLLYRCSRVKRFELWTLLAISALNYVFYIFHQVVIPYYPYGPALLIFGFLLSKTPPIIVLEKRPRFVLAAVFLFLLSLTLGSLRTPENHYWTQTNHYRSCFSGQSVVWGELRTGTVEYTTLAKGFRYYWGSDEARKLTITWLNSKGFSQFFWLNEIKSERKKVPSVLRELGLDFTEKTCALGNLIIVKGQTKDDENTPS